MNYNLTLTINWEDVGVALRRLQAYPALDNNCDWVIKPDCVNNVAVINFSFKNVNKEELQDYIDDVSDNNLLGSIYED